MSKNLNQSDDNVITMTSNMYGLYIYISKSALDILALIGQVSLRKRKKEKQIRAWLKHKNFNKTCYEKRKRTSLETNTANTVKERR